MEAPKPWKLRFSLRQLFVFVVFLSFILWAIFQPEKYEREEVVSTYGYPPEYRIKPIDEQIAILKQHFPNLISVDISVASKPLPAGAEGYFAIPRWQKIAPTYAQAVDKVLDAIMQRRVLWGSAAGPVLETAKKSDSISQISRNQNTPNILIVPAQFGLRHRGRSFRRVRAVMGYREFGLGAYEVSIMLLAHPERLGWSSGLLWITCAGDADGGFSVAPLFSFGGGEVGFGAVWCGRAHEYCGSASAFLSQ